MSWGRPWQGFFHSSLLVHQEKVGCLYRHPLWSSATGPLCLPDVQNRH